MMRKLILMKKVFLTTLIVLSNCLLDSCCPEPTCYSITVNNALNFSLNEAKALAFQDTVQSTNYAIQIEGSANTADATCGLHKSFGSRLYASIDCEDDFRLKNPLVNISIRSQADLNENYPAGSELSGLFVAYGLYTDCLEASDTLANCLETFAQFEGSLLTDNFNSFLASNIFFNDQNDTGIINLFVLNTEELIQTNKHQFKLIFSFEDGNVVELETDEIVLK